jgi:hypothetical protein
MQKHFSLKHWRMSAIVVLAALAVIASASQAFAQQPGEANSYNLKTVATAGNLHAEGSLSEVRNAGNLLDAWRANDLTNQVWLSYNNGSPFTISSTTQTIASPTVVPFGPSNFLVFHVGTDSHIYYAAVSGTNQATGWIQVPGQTTNMSVSVTPLGPGLSNEYMVYRGSGNDTRVWGTWMGSDQQWSTPENIGGGLAVAAPAICMNNPGLSLWVEVIGTDNQVWTTHQSVGAQGWAGWAPQGVFSGPNNANGGGAIEAPRCAATDNGNVLLDYVDTNAHPHYAVFNNGGMVTGWTEDSVSLNNGWQTVNSVGLTSADHRVWSLFTGITSICTGQAQSAGNCVPTTAAANQVWWKQVYDAQQ